jgi:hypothetical protein
MLGLIELRIGHNSIETLPDDMFDGPLGVYPLLLTPSSNP